MAFTNCLSWINQNDLIAVAIDFSSKVFLRLSAQYLWLVQSGASLSTDLVMAPQGSSSDMASI
ncbi:hypothetical protein [Mesorhizobium sp. M0579]|uniref:hypothetical protein n=1 Tax=Mesorhizobium sp. M0579 TaxID=2956962 RepID=UPI003338C331